MKIQVIITHYDSVKNARNLHNSIMKVMPKGTLLDVSKRNGVWYIRDYTFEDELD